MKKNIIVIVLLSISLMVAALEMPNIHSSLMLDAYFYHGDNANEGVYDNTSRFQVRKAALSFSGLLDERINYGLELGVATCVGAGDTFRLLEAELMYALTDDMSLGLKQGHIMRGFCYNTECTQRLSLEKPWFQKTFAPCHPLGMVVEGFIDIAAESGLQYELGLLNGVNGTFDQEHDFNLGLMLDTPLSGLALSASVTHTAGQYYDAGYQPYFADGHRWGVGLEYRTEAVWMTSEYYAGKGFSTEEQEMNAWYAQAGYAFPVNSNWLSKIVPWVKYEVWDKDSALEVESDYVYLDTGFNFHLSRGTMLRLVYTSLIDIPGIAEKSPDSFTIRLQTEF